MASESCILKYVFYGKVLRVYKLRKYTSLERWIDIEAPIDFVYYVFKMGWSEISFSEIGPDLTICVASLDSG